MGWWIQIKKRIGVVMLYDHLGRPIKRNLLTKEIAEPNVASVRNIWHDSAANGLNPTALAEIVSAAERNDIVAYLTLAEEMEERDLHYQSVLGTRKRAVTSLTPMIEAASDDEHDVMLADAVREEIIDTDQFADMLPMAMDAIGKSYSCVEIMWDRGARWIPSKYKWRDQRFFVFDNDAMEEIRMLDEQDPSQGIQLPAFKFIIHRPQIKMGVTIRGGLARMAAVAYMLKGYSVSDWWAFMEVFGMPWRIGRFDSSATESEQASLMTAVRQIGTDAACIVPRDMDIEIKEASRTSSGGDKLFMNAADWVDKQVSKGVLGQVATTEGTPGRLGNEDAQENVREDIRRDDARQLAATITRDLIKSYVHLNWGPQKRYPKFRLIFEEAEDLKLLSEALTPFIDRGLRVQASVILDRFGIAEAEDGAPVLQPKSGGPAPAASAQPGDEEPTPDENQPPGEEDIDMERDRLVASLMRRMRHGEQLSEAENDILLTAMFASKDGQDTIERMAADELGGWRAMMDPVLQPIIEHAARAKDAQEFTDGLKEIMAGVDSTEFAKRVATLNLIARGLGDSTDDV